MSRMHKYDSHTKFIEAVNETMFDNFVDVHVQELREYVQEACCMNF